MSSQNKKATENAWNTLVKKYPPLQGQPHEIETADLDFDGVFYRLKAGTFADRSGADNLCRDIKALGGTCIVKKNNEYGQPDCKFCSDNSGDCAA